MKRGLYFIWEFGSRRPQRQIRESTTFFLLPIFKLNQNKKIKLKVKFMKKLSLFFIVMCVILKVTVAQVSVWDGSHTTWTNGTGTENDPYLIESAAQLAHLRYYIIDNGVTANTYWKQTVNIDLNLLSWLPIGYGSSRPFCGHFNGNGKTNANLYINSTSQDRAGLFGGTEGGSVRNVGIIGNSSITISILGNNPDLIVCIGGIISYATNTVIENCYNNSTLLGNQNQRNYHVGGIVGHAENNVTINNCYNTGEVSSKPISISNWDIRSCTGGIVGYNSSGSITNCYNTGAVIASTQLVNNVIFDPYSYAGGIVGYSSSGSTNIDYCYNRGAVSAVSTSTSSISDCVGYAGGIVGFRYGSSLEIRNCYNRGNISATGVDGQRSSGILGTGTGTIINSYNTGAATHGIRGSSSTTTNCYYLSGSGSSTYGGEPKTAEFMKSMDFVNLLNSGPDPNNAYALDANVVNAGYAILLWQLPPAAPTITTTSLPNGIVGTAYGQWLTATGTTPITWSLVSGNLPTGLSLSSAGAISGTPATAGIFNFTVKAENIVGNNTKALSITITAPEAPPVITTTSLPGGLIGTAYSEQLAATGTTPITWTLASGSLPTGLTLYGSGIISGTPTANGTFTFGVQAINSAGSNTKELSIAVTTTAVAPTITTTSLPDGKTGTTYSTQLEATGSAPIAWSLENGTLPTGLTLYGNGTVSGMPTVAGTFSFTVKATNSAGNATKALAIKIEDGVGISENEISGIRIYPNPTTGELRIEIADQARNDGSDVRIFDIYGRALQSHTSLMSPETTIDISYLPSSIYFVKIRTESGEVVRKVVKE